MSAPKVNPSNLPTVTEATIIAWRSAGLRVYLRRVLGGYLVRVEGQ